ncbi:AGAP011738-PA, partial [Anopheles gambiae str. PEST]
NDSASKGIVANECRKQCFLQQFGAARFCVAAGRSGVTKPKKKKNPAKKSDSDKTSPFGRCRRAAGVCVRVCAHFRVSVAESPPPRSDFVCDCP